MPNGDQGRPTVASSGPAPVNPAPSQPYHVVTIEKVCNGFIVKVGCRTLITKTEREMFAGLSMYWVDPAAAEELYCNK